MADVEVTLGAKNEASAVLRQFSNEVTQTAQQVEFSIRGLAQLAGVTAAVIGIVEAGRAVVGFASSSVAAFDDLNRSSIKLAETVALIPGAGKAASDEMVKVANSLERMTNVDSGRIQDQMAQALRRGAGVGDIEDMAEAALGLSRVFDRDLASAMRMVEDATKGNFEAFRGLIPNIDQLATTEERLAAVSELATKGLLNKADSAKGALESSEALNVAVKNLYETIGALIAPIRDVVYKGFVLISDYIVGSLNPDLQTFEDLIKSITETVDGVAEAMLTGFIGAFTAAEVVVLNFSDSVGIAFDYVSLRAIAMVEDIKYSISSMLGQIQKIPANLGTITFIGANQALMGMGITSSNAEFEESLRQANERLQKEFAVPLRQITEAESKLQESLNSRLGVLFNEYDSKFQERVKSLTKEVKIPFAIDLQSRATPEARQGTQDLMRDLQAFESRIMTRGPAQSPVDRMAESMAKTAANTAEMLGEQKETNRILGVTVSPGDDKFVEIR
jgi:hypothetical protein